MKLFDKTIFRKLFLQMGAILLGIILAAITVIAVYYGKWEIDRVRRELKDLSTGIGGQVQNLVTDMEKLALYVSTSADVSESFVSAKRAREENFTLYQKNIHIINSIMVPNSNSKYRVSLYNGGAGNFISFGRPVDKEKAAAELTTEQYDDFYRNIVRDNTQIRVSQDPWASGEKIHIRVFRNIYDPNLLGEVVGVVEVSQPLRSLDTVFSGQSCLIIRESGCYGDDQIMGTDYIRERMVTSQGWEIVSGKKKSSVFASAGLMIALIFAIGIAFLIGAYILLYEILKRIVQPLGELTDQVNEITLNNLQISCDTIPPGTIDEVENLRFAFDNMLHKLHVSIQESMDAKTCELQANYIALQSQMDPHFLYNMLSVIRIFSKEGDFGSTAKMCDYLGDMLRYISDYQDDLVYAEQEVSHAVNYMKLMKYRYEDNFDYQINLSIPFLESKVQIPKLCLQPIVENAFSHAFKSSVPPWRITIKGYLEDDRWLIDVRDNGCGMSQEEMEDLLQRIDAFAEDISGNIGTLKLGGMGLINTVARLKIKYKEELIFRIETKKLEGTAFIIGGTMR